MATKRENFEFVIDILKHDNFVAAKLISEEDRADLISFAEHEIDLLDSKAVKAKATAEKNKAADDNIAAKVREYLTNDFQTINEIVAKVNDDDVTAGKVQYRLRTMVEAGEVEKQEISIPGGTGNKARKLVAYRLIALVDAD